MPCRSFAKQFDFRLKKFLNAVTEDTFSRDGMTLSYSRYPKPCLLYKIKQRRLFYIWILALIKNSLDASTALTVLSKLSFKVGPDSAILL